MITKNDISLLKKFENKKCIKKDELIVISHLQKLNLIKIDDFYFNSVMDIMIYYAKTTQLGMQIVKKFKNENINENKKKKKSFLNLFKK